MMATEAPLPQHMQALAEANRTRLARAAMKREIAAGEKSVIEVLGPVPACAVTMTLSDLLMAQHRWGRSRVRRLLLHLNLGEHKHVGSLTQRQADALKNALATIDERLTAIVLQDSHRVLHLEDPTTGKVACDAEKTTDWTVRVPRVWADSIAQDRCGQCIAVRGVKGWVVDA